MASPALDRIEPCGSTELPGDRHVNFQAFPQTGHLAGLLDLSSADLRGRLETALLDRPVYSYIVTSVKALKGQLVQTGCAPNFQGGRITLCTCKHKDRASPPPRGRRGPDPSDPWRGVWVAGFCSSTQLRPRALFYLMLVERACGSHTAAWHYLNGPRAKSASRDRFGDIYEPRPQPGLDPWRGSSYEPHLQSHVHDPHGRTKDIERTYHSRHPALLIGALDNSYLWSRSQVSLSDEADVDWGSAHHRFYPRLADLLAICI